MTGAYAYLWLLTDAPPSTEPGGPVEVDVEPGGRPTAGTALLRLLASVPALLVSLLLTMVAAVAWVVAAASILATERAPDAVTDLLATKVRYELRLVAYHLSLVDTYPALTDARLPHAPHSGAA